jgi:hypothetical protein
MLTIRRVLSSKDESPTILISAHHRSWHFHVTVMMLVVPRSSAKDAKEKRRYWNGIAAGADGNLLFLFSSQFNYSEECPVARGQPRRR